MKTVRFSIEGLTQIVRHEAELLAVSRGSVVLASLGTLKRGLYSWPWGIRFAFGLLTRVFDLIGGRTLVSARFYRLCRNLPLFRDLFGLVRVAILSNLALVRDKDF